jgi:ubiquinone biosynthesis protein
MKKHIENGAVRRVMVGTDRSDSAEQAVQWAALFAERYVAELLVVQVIVPQNPRFHGVRSGRAHARSGSRR